VQVHDAVLALRGGEDGGAQTLMEAIVDEDITEMEGLALNSFGFCVGVAVLR
jgi:hypothetical protein